MLQGRRTWRELEVKWAKDALGDQGRRFGKNKLSGADRSEKKVF